MPTREAQARMTESELHLDNVSQNRAMLSGLDTLGQLLITARNLLPPEATDAIALLNEAIDYNRSHLTPLELTDVQRQKLQGAIQTARHERELRQERERARLTAAAQGWDRVYGLFVTLGRHLNDYRTARALVDEGLRVSTAGLAQVAKDAAAVNGKTVVIRTGKRAAQNGGVR